MGLEWLAREGGGDAAAAVRHQLLTLTGPPAEGERIEEIALGQIDPSPYQARRVFAPGALEELKDSIRRNGLLQPVVVRPRPGGRYELVAGERRWRAAGLLGWVTIPAVVRPVDDLTAHLLGQAENDDREDISAWERALGYVRLREHMARERGSPPSLTELGALRCVNKSTVSRYVTVGEAFPPEAVAAEGMREEDFATLTLPVLLRAVRKPSPQRFEELRAALRAHAERATPGNATALNDPGGLPPRNRSNPRHATQEEPRRLRAWERYYKDRSIRIETPLPACELSPEMARSAAERMIPALAALSATTSGGATPASLLAEGDGGRLVFIPDGLPDAQEAGIRALLVAMGLLP